MPAPLELTDVHKSFGTKVALDGVTFAVGEGEVFGLLGPNGAGKTTIIRLALDILRADAGEVRLLGDPVRTADHDRVAYLPEERGLYRRERLIDVLAYLARLKGVPRREAKARAGAWLEKVGLLVHAKKRVDQLSKGMSQKAQIAATLVADPELAILDEPFSGLDPIHVAQVLEIIAERRAAGRTTVLSTHRMDRVEAICDRVVILRSGQVVRYGSLAEIRAEHPAREVRVELTGSIQGVPGVAGLIETSEGAVLTLAPGAEPAAVLAALVGAGVSVSRFEPVQPSVEAIFVSAVGGAALPSAATAEVGP